MTGCPKPAKKCYQPVVQVPSTKGPGHDILVYLSGARVFGTFENVGAEQISFFDTASCVTFGNGVTIDLAQVSSIEAPPGDNPDACIVIASDGHQRGRVQVPVSFDQVRKALEHAPQISYDNVTTSDGRSAVRLAAPQRRMTTVPSPSASAAYH